MSAATSPNPNNMLLLMVVGVGAYWFLTRRAVAQPYYPQQQQPSRSAQNTQAVGALLGAGIGALGRLFGGSAGQSNPVIWDNLTNDMPRIDGVAVNPPNQSAFDWWAINGTGGD